MPLIYSSFYNSEGGGGGGGDPHFASVVLLVGFDGADGATSSTDESPSGHALTFTGDAQLDTAEKKFGASSLLVDGTGDEVSAPDGSAWQFPGEFTMECFFRTALTSSSSQGIIVKFGSSGSRSFELAVTRGASSQTVRFRWSNDGATIDHNLASGNLGIALNTWYHVAVDRDSGGTMRLYFEGAMVASKSGATGENHNTSDSLGIGRNANGGVRLNGHIDELRITKGVARYASDAGFTVPAAAFPRS